MNFFSDISLYWLFPFGIACFGLAFLYYRKQSRVNELKTVIRFSLIVLRSSTLFLLGLLLFGVIFERKEVKVEKPVFITLTDNSSSLLNYADSSKVKSRVAGFHAKLQEKFKDRFEFKSYTIGDGVSLDSIRLDGSKSNLNAGFDFIYNEFYNRNVGGITFISDGNFNEGVSPIYGAEKINLTPIFTIGVGDTVVKRDQLLRTVSTNDIAFYKNKFPIEISIEGHKMGKGNTEISLWKGQRKIDSKTISYTDGNLDFINVSFMTDADDIGFISYTVKLKKESSESSYENNSRTVYVEVIDSRSKVFVFANAPHPDVSAIKQELDKNDNMDVSTVLIDEWDGSLDGCSLAIWHNPSEDGSDLYRAIRATKTPALYLLGLNSSRSFVSDMNIGVRLPSTRSTDQVQGVFANEFQLFDVSSQLKRAVKRWQPLTVLFGRLRQHGNNTLLKQMIGGIVKEVPVLYFNSTNGVKYGVLVGEGLWRWKLSEYAESENNDLFNELIQKTTQYLTVKSNLEPLRINFPKRVLSRDPIILRAEFYNASFDLITSPEIALYLTNTEGVSTEYTFGKNENNYTLDLGTLSQGVYSWKASAKYSGLNHKKSGSFIVENSSLEDLETRANHNILEQISTRSNGQFYPLNKTDKLFNDVENRKDIVSVSYQESTFLNLIDWKLLLVVIVFLLSVEWLVRRYSGLY
ncbi:MAG: hypothetical protein P8N52_03250 [Crocinitomicaceae bacterium]|nr:hypothetical protein [Crocinitomicaceae bacterium]